MEKIKQAGKQLGKKKIITIGAVTLLALGAVGYKVYADTQNQKEIDQAIMATTRQLDQIDLLGKEYLEFYEDEDSKGYLKKDLSQYEIDNYQAKLSKEWELTVKPLNSDELDKATNKLAKQKKSLELDMQKLQEQFDSQEQVNALFQKEQAINSSTVKADLVITDDLKLEGVFSISEDDTSKWAESMRQILKNATTQLDQIKKATEQVNKLFKDDKVVDKVDDKVLKSAQAEVKKIKNEKAKKAQEARVKQVTDEVTKRKKSEEKAKAEEQAKAFGGTAVVDDKGNVKVVDASGAEMTKSGDGETATWTTSVNNNTGGNYQDNSGSTQGGGNSWTPPATGGGNQTTPPVNNSGGISNGAQTAPPASNGGTSGNSTGNTNWTGENPNNGGTTEGGTVGGIEEIPGIEIGNPPW